MPPSPDTPAANGSAPDMKRTPSHSSAAWGSHPQRSHGELCLHLHFPHPPKLGGLPQARAVLCSLEQCPHITQPHSPDGSLPCSRRDFLFSSRDRRKSKRPQRCKVHNARLRQVVSNLMGPVTKKNPRVVSLPGFYRLSPQLVGLFDPGAVRVSGDGRCRPNGPLVGTIASEEHPLIDLGQLRHLPKVGRNTSLVAFSYLEVSGARRKERN